MATIGFRALGSVVLFTASACTGVETQMYTVAPSPDPTPTSGPIVADDPAPPLPAPVPFSLPEGFLGVVDRPPLVATAGDHLVVLRWLKRCTKVWGPTGTITLPRLGTGTFTPPGSGFRSCDSWIEALDRDGAPIWQNPVMPGHPFATILGDRLLASGPRGLTLFDVAAGTVTGSVADPVIGREACVDASHERVFVSDWDDRTKDAVVDLTTMHVRPAGPERCPVRPFTDCDQQTALACWQHRDERRPPTVPVGGFYEEGTLRTATDEVLLGRQVQGRKLPMVVAVDPVRHAKRWSLVVPSPDAQVRAAEARLFPHRFADMANGKFFVEYDAWASHPHLAAFDMKDGSRLWDVAIDELVAFTPTTDRIYLTDRRGMRVLDASTGEERVIERRTQPT